MLAAKPLEDWIGDQLRPRYRHPHRKRALWARLAAFELARKAVDLIDQDFGLETKGLAGLGKDDSSAMAHEERKPKMLL